MGRLGRDPGDHRHRDAAVPEDIAAADVVLLAVDIKVGGRERFEGKRVAEVGTSTVIASPTKLLTAIEPKLSE